MVFFFHDVDTGTVAALSAGFVVVTAVVKSLLTSLATHPTPPPPTLVSPHRCSFLVSSIVQVTKRAKIVTFSTRSPLQLMPGGHVRVQVPGVGTMKSYTPFEVADDFFSIVVKLYPSGVCSGYLYSLAAGDMVVMRAPIAPSLPSLHGVKNLILVGAGTGFVPMYSLASFYVKDPSVSSITVVGCFRDEKDMVIVDRMQDLAENDCGHVSFHLVFSQRCQPPPPMRGVTSIFLSRFCVEHMLDIGTFEKTRDSASSFVLICGPPGFNHAISGFVKTQFGALPEKVKEL